LRKDKEKKKKRGKKEHSTSPGRSKVAKGGPKSRKLSKAASQEKRGQVLGETNKEESREKNEEKCAGQRRKKGKFLRYPTDGKKHTGTGGKPLGPHRKK